MTTEQLLAVIRDVYPWVGRMAVTDEKHMEAMRAKVMLGPAIEELEFRLKEERLYLGWPK